MVVMPRAISARRGGAIWVNGNAITGTTIYNGSAMSSGVGGSQFDAGAIYIYGETTTIANSTITNNYAEDNGGGIYINNAATLNITNSTMSGNIAINEYGGNIFNHYGNLNMQNTILANSPSGDGYDCYNEGGSITANVASLIEYNGPTSNSCQ